VRRAARARRVRPAGREARRRARAGGELQRFAIAVVAAQQADVYMIDEPSSYLDVRQRLKAAQARRPPPHAVQPTTGCRCSSYMPGVVMRRIRCGLACDVVVPWSKRVPDADRAQGPPLY